jgi:hypothetical protein
MDIQRVDNAHIRIGSPFSHTTILCVNILQGFFMGKRVKMTYWRACQRDSHCEGQRDSRTSAFFDKVEVFKYNFQSERSVGEWMRGTKDIKKCWSADR